MVEMVYPYLVAAHVTAVVFLVGGLLAQEVILNTIAQTHWEKQANMLAALQRFDRAVITPALLLTWIFGLSLALGAGWLTSRWLMIKLVFVVALSALHGFRSGRMRFYIRTGTAVSKSPGVSLGIMIAMLVIAVLAIAKPV